MLSVNLTLTPWVSDIYNPEGVKFVISNQQCELGEAHCCRLVDVYVDKITYLVDYLPTCCRQLKIYCIKKAQQAQELIPEVS